MELLHYAELRLHLSRSLPPKTLLSLPRQKFHNSQLHFTKTMRMPVTQRTNCWICTRRIGSRAIRMQTWLDFSILSLTRGRLMGQTAVHLGARAPMVEIHTALLYAGISRAVTNPFCFIPCPKRKKQYVSTPNTLCCAFANGH